MTSQRALLAFTPKSEHANPAWFSSECPQNYSPHKVLRPFLRPFLLTSAPVAASQIFTIVSADPLTIRLPSDEKATHFTSPLCPLTGHCGSMEYDALYDLLPSVKVQTHLPARVCPMVRICQRTGCQHQSHPGSRVSWSAPSGTHLQRHPVSARSQWVSKFKRVSKIEGMSDSRWFLLQFPDPHGRIGVPGSTTDPSVPLRELAGGMALLGSTPRAPR